MSQQLIASHMSEFEKSVSSIEDKFGIIFNTVKDTLNELNSAKECLTQASANDKSINVDEINSFKEKISDFVYKECESMKESLKELVLITNDSNSFQQKEKEARNKINQGEFDEKILKMLLQSQKSTNTQEEFSHPKYEELEELIENAKNGININDGEDLVMDTPQNQVIKCPITGKPIENAIKNTQCDHSYEKAAIVAYLKSKPNRKCPFAGCKKPIVLPKH